jgi:hypothetical protein
MSAVGGNYISDGAIMAWLANQQDRIYGELKESMGLAERRADFASKLVDIKAQLEDANRRGNFGEVDKELQAFLTEYGSEPEFAEICESLTPMANQIHENWAYAVDGYQKDYQEYLGTLKVYDTFKALGDSVELTAEATALLEKGRPEAPDVPVNGYADEEIKTWTTLIDGKLDSSSKNDQLTMIHIQELRGTLDQSTQLASSLIAGGDKTASAIINNLA